MKLWESDKPTVGGVKVPMWFWAAERYPAGREPVVNKEPIPTDAATQPEKSGDEKCLDIVLQNPDVSGAALLNAMKTSGLKVIDSTIATEANAASAAPELQRQADKQIQLAARLLESSGSYKADPNKFRVVLLEEGLGNLGDLFYYTREAIESAVPVFTGRKFFIDHPSMFEEETRPERSVRDLAGHFDNIKVIEGDTGQALLTGDLVIVNCADFDIVRAQFQHAIEYSKKFPGNEFVGLSINASGDAEEMEIDKLLGDSSVPKSAITKIQKAKEQGETTVRRVTKIVDAFSCDEVTSPGARGRVLSIIEREVAMKQKKIEVKKEDEKEPAPMAKEEKPADKAKPGEQKDIKTGDHDDEAKDKELIRSMLDKYVGEPTHDEEVEALGREAHKAALEMGLEGEEAAKCAGYSVKMAKHMASMKKEIDPEVKSEEKPEEASEEKECDKTEAKEETESEEKESFGKKESEVVSLAARIAFLEGELKKRELVEHMETKFLNSGLPRSATKLFKEKAGSLLTVKSFDEKFTLFVETFNARGVVSNAGFMVNPEKTIIKDSKQFDFSNCKK